MVDFGAAVEDCFLEGFNVEKGGRRSVLATSVCTSPGGAAWVDLVSVALSLSSLA